LLLVLVWLLVVQRGRSRGRCVSTRVSSEISGTGSGTHTWHEPSRSYIVLRQTTARGVRRFGGEYFAPCPRLVALDAARKEQRPMCQQTGVFGDQRHWQRHIHLAWATQKRYTPPTNNVRSPATIWVEYVAPYPRLVACDEATKEQRPMRQQAGVLGDQQHWQRHIHLAQTARCPRHAAATDALFPSLVDSTMMMCIDNHQHPRCHATSPRVKRRPNMIFLQIIG
jgi:hypothetical protein